ncbi:DJ-1/PfpI family protein [Hymenobacter cellulosilyticus]|uniref:DJ-1/PfpI family protein n=1 Tax=Hymenobacter cellulosilyticus TaxID=2932248 RepID=A0A8T9PXM8_9BACT|nr:DJ-1/PfpI family protein [Hymenobacter cellulosilyticus]UOQ70146.1 DJ-1/PfpI family protein [Hymenobacter cellulosilyticus]
MKKPFRLPFFLTALLLVSQVVCQARPQHGYSADDPDFPSPDGSCAVGHRPLAAGREVKTIAFYLQDGVEVLDFAGPLEVFTSAGYQVFTVTKAAGPITSQGVLRIQPDYTLQNAPKADIVAFFGGNSNAVFKDPEVQAWLRAQQDVAYYFSVCTGALMLAEAGILDNQVATTFHSTLDKLQRDYPAVDVRRQVRFVDNGRVITTAGISAGIDGALHLVAKLQGLNAAKRTAYYMEYDNWKPGDGLLLAPDNPYTKLPAAKDLAPYTGTYQYPDGQQLVIKPSPHPGELLAVVGQNSYPLYYERENEFSNVAGKPVVFQRGTGRKVTGYSLEQTGPVYQKQR